MKVSWRSSAAHAGFEKAHRHAAAAAMREVRYWRAQRASAEVVRPPVEAEELMRT